MTHVPTMELIFHGRYMSHGMDVPKSWAMEWIFTSLGPWNGYSIVPKKISLLLTTISSTTTLTPINYYHLLLITITNTIATTTSN